jgi:hypothetical protein
MVFALFCTVYVYSVNSYNNADKRCDWHEIFIVFFCTAYYTVSNALRTKIILLLSNFDVLYQFLVRY